MLEVMEVLKYDDAMSGAVKVLIYDIAMSEADDIAMPEVDHIPIVVV